MQQQNTHWLYGLSAPMVALNAECGSDYLSPQFYPDNSFDLTESWGITNRQELLDTVFRMTDGGHAEALSEGYFLRRRMFQHQWQSYVNQQSELQQIFLSFVSSTAGVCGSGGIRAWDIGRMSFLLRIGVLNQFITEQESLWLHSRLSLRARHYYDSWQSYFAGYLFGRCYWLNLDIDDPVILNCALHRMHEQNVYILQGLTSYPDSPLQALPWYIDWQEIEKPTSLQELEWS